MKNVVKESVSRIRGLVLDGRSVVALQYRILILKINL